LGVAARGAGSVDPPRSSPQRFGPRCLESKQHSDAPPLKGGRQRNTTMDAPQAFMYASEPQAVPTKRSRPKYRDDENDLGMSNNIMFDRRVVRGNTYAAQVVTQNAAREMERLRKENERAMKREMARRRMDATMDPGTPRPVDGRVHADVQTDTYLEELTDRPIEVDANTQTDAVMDRPPSPLFMPAKSGVDKETQVDVAEIFDFDIEVRPILEVLVGKTLQTSMMEVLEEEELDAIRKRQEEFEQMRNAELMEVQRMEAEATRRHNEKQRRVKQEKERKRLQRELKEKVAARSFAKNYLAELNADVFADLESTGEFYDPVRKEVSDVFLPWLVDSVVGEMDGVQTAQQLADDLLRAALAKAAELQEAAKQAHEDELRRIEAEKARLEEERKKAEEAAAADAPADGEAEEGQAE